MMVTTKFLQLYQENYPFWDQRVQMYDLPVPWILSPYHPCMVFGSSSHMCYEALGKGEKSSVGQANPDAARVLGFDEAESGKLGGEGKRDRLDLPGWAPSRSLWMELFHPAK